MLSERARPRDGKDEALLRLIAEQSPAGVLVIQNGRFRYVNPAFSRMLGYQSDELIGQLGLEELAASGEREHLSRLQQRLDAGQTAPIRTVFRAVRKDGSSLTGELLARGVMSDGTTTIVGSLVDVTERERAREQAVRREHLLRGILSNSADGIVLIDAYALIQEWNPAQERLTGLKRSEAVGEPLFDVLFRLTPADQRTIDAYVKLKDHLAQLLRSNSAADFAQPIESEIVRPDGRKRSIEIQYFTVRQNGDQKLASVTRDVTERRMLERAELEMLRTREQFVAEVSRALHDPLEELHGQLKLLGSPSDTDEEQRQAACERAASTVDRLSDLVRGLGEVARFESGIELAMEEVDLRRILQQALESVKDQAAAKGIPVAYTPDADPPPVRGNGPRLLQAVMSLIRNAIRMSENGSPVIVTAVAHHGEVTVQVTDQGPGIPSDAEPAVFAKRAPGLLPGEQETGAGDLELYLSRKIIEAHGGRMGMRSQLGVGSTFYFSLPISADQAN